MGFTVVGQDGRRIERGVSESYAHESASRIHAETGETIDVVPDGVQLGPVDPGLVVDGIARDAPDADADEPGQEPPADAPPVRRRRRKA